VVVLVLVLGCGGPPGAGDDGGGLPDIRRPPPTGAWSEPIVVADGDVGMHLDLAVLADGSPAVAFFPMAGRDDGLCEEIAGGSVAPPERVRWNLSYAEEDADGSFRLETVVPMLVLGAPLGLSLGVGGDGEPAIAALAGEADPGNAYCGAHDVALYQRSGGGSWSAEIAVRDSGEAATGMPASDFGSVVGLWPALAFDPDGNPAVAYKDVHSGSIQLDDLRRADLELAWREGGGWRHIAIDPGFGAGDYNQLVFDGEGRPVAVYYNPTDTPEMRDIRGLWAARSDDGETWERVQLELAAIREGPDAVVGPDGRLHVAYYDGSRREPVVWTLTNAEQFTDLAAGWEDETVLSDRRHDEGRYPSLAVAPDGRLALAYYRCMRRTDAADAPCRPDDDAVVFAFRDAAGGWTVEVVDEGDPAGACGLWPAVGFDGEGRALLAYACQRLVSGSLVYEVRFARRAPL
jgi:hypothetical protein